MAHSSYDLDQVVVLDYLTGAVKWMTVSEAARFVSARGGREVLKEEDPMYSYYTALAGPRPIRRIETEEDYNEGG